MIHFRNRPPQFSHVCHRSAHNRPTSQCEWLLWWQDTEILTEITQQNNPFFSNHKIMAWLTSASIYCLVSITAHHDNFSIQFIRMVRQSWLNLDIEIRVKLSIIMTDNQLYPVCKNLHPISGQLQTHYMLIKSWLETSLAETSQKHRLSHSDDD